MLKHELLCRENIEIDVCAASCPFRSAFAIPIGTRSFNLEPLPMHAYVYFIALYD